MTAGGGMAIEGAYNGCKAFGPQISINNVSSMNYNSLKIW